MFGRFKRPVTPAVQEKAVAYEANFTDPSAIFHFFNEITGINFDQKEAITTSKLIRFAQDHECFNFEELLTLLHAKKNIFESLINLLTVNETYFYREMGQIGWMANKIAADDVPVRILCAPGSTGEEPYSILIALSEKGVPLSRVSIVSIDINTEVIKKGKEGCYTARALHRLDDSLRDRYFTAEGDRYHLNETLRSHVTFIHCNIFDANFKKLEKFDYLFSRNMLIYFDRHKASQAMERIASLCSSASSIIFFGHADVLGVPESLQEHYDRGVKYYTLKN